MSAPVSAERHADHDAALLLVPEAAAHLRLPVSTVYRLIKSGELPALVLSPRRIRVRRSDLDAWLTAHITGGVA